MRIGAAMQHIQHAEEQRRLGDGDVLHLNRETQQQGGNAIAEELPSLRRG